MFCSQNVNLGLVILPGLLLTEDLVTYSLKSACKLKWAERTLGPWSGDLTHPASFNREGRNVMFKTSLSFKYKVK